MYVSGETILKTVWWTEDCHRQHSGAFPCSLWLGRWNVNGCSKLKPTVLMPSAIPEHLLASSLAFFLKFAMNDDLVLKINSFPTWMFLTVSFGCICPCLFIYSVCCAWHLFCFLSLCVPGPQGCLGLWRHAIWYLEYLSFGALWLILLGFKKLSSIAKLAEWQNQPTYKEARQGWRASGSWW